MKSLLRYALVALALCLSSPAFALVCGTGGGCFWVGGTGTWDNSTTTNWASTSGGAGGVAVPSATDAVTFDASSGAGTVTVAATINGSNTIFTLTASASSVALDFSVNNPTITSKDWNFNNASLTLTLGTSTLHQSNTNGGGFTLNSSMTFSGASATIVFDGVSALNNARTLALAGKSIGAATFNGLTVPITVGGGTQNITGGGTIGTLTINGFQQLITIGNGTTLTCTTLNISGTAAAPVSITGGASASTFTVTNAPTISWSILTKLTFTNAATANNSFNGGGNTNVTINNPVVGGGGSGGGYIIGG